MTYYILQPAAPGVLGENVVMDTSVHPPRIERAHLELDSWLGDELIESYPCFFISDRVVELLRQAQIENYELRDVEVTLVEEDLTEEELASIPKLHWLVASGTAGRDDLASTPRGDLVVSDHCLAILREAHVIDHCQLEEYAQD